MIYEVTTNSQDLKIYPENEIEEIAQNILMILTTPKYSVPLDREFGIRASLLDEPINADRNRLTAEIISEIKKCESRARVREVTYDSDEIGKLNITVKFEVA